jgi:polysaccharide export outer membrane protein
MKVDMVRLAAVSMVFGMLAAAQTPAQQPKPEAFKPEETKPVEAPAPVDPKTYQIGAEDVITVKVWNEGRLSGNFSVRPDGRITMDLVGDIEAWHLTPEQLSARIKERLSTLLNSPEVTVAVAQVRSKKYYIVGRMNRTGEFPLVVPTTVMEAISKAGGFQDFANQKNITIVRGDRRLRFNYKEYLEGKNLKQNIPLEPGDTIVVR